jgi:hypothetical protein
MTITGKKKKKTQAKIKAAMNKVKKNFFYYKKEAD